ncbi:MAG: hypothetical protein ACRCSP_04280 [Rhodoglobus sp.]
MAASFLGAAGVGPCAGDCGYCHTGVIDQSGDGLGVHRDHVCSGRVVVMRRAMATAPVPGTSTLAISGHAKEIKRIAHKLELG